jgi:ArsR family transcriptional regulator
MLLLLLIIFRILDGLPHSEQPYFRACLLRQNQTISSFRYISKYFLTCKNYFHIYGSMKKQNVVSALAALAQDSRLEVYRLLVQAGPEGMCAGDVSSALKLVPNTLTFHFDRLREAGLVTVRRDGRSMIYAARFDTMNALLSYLTENCCQGRADQCAPVECKTPALAMARQKETV